MPATSHVRQNAASDAATASRAKRWLVTYVLGLSAALIGAILLLTGGHLVYSLDDPFIHLTLARSIAHGEYGVNPGWPASPSSSILWPFLLAPLTSVPGFPVIPLIINVACAVLTALVLNRSLRRFIGAPSAAVITGLAVTLLNVVGVAFTGMEHSLQVLLAALVTEGVLAVRDSGRVPGWLPVVMVLGPLVRYEGIAVSAAAAVILAVTGHRRVAALATLAWVLPLVAFSAFLVSAGLDPLPSSVTMKNGAYGALAWDHITMLLRARVTRAFTQPPFVAALVLTITDVVVRRRVTLLSGYVLMLLAMHLLGGQFGWFARYEVYVLVAIAAPLVGMVLSWSLPLRSVRAWAVAGLLIVSQVTMVQATVRTPLAADEMYRQQYQTARFVRDFWRQPIAVNDLGLVSYYGGQVTLDLWGLGDQQSRELRMLGSPGWMDRQVRQHDVHLVAIYTGWFGDSIPSAWTPVAEFSSPPQVVAASSVVTFYAVRPGDIPQACAALAAWAPTLPGHDSVNLTCPP